MFQYLFGRMTLPVILVGLTACENASPKLVGEPPRETRKSAGTELQTFNPSVDVLFVIDDSGSMYTHQKNLQDNVDLFTNGISTNKFVDYHIGVISTSDTFSSTGHGGGVLAGRTKIVDRATINGASILKENIMVGISGSGFEKVFDPLHMALTDPVLSTKNQGFYRPSAYLAVVIITDAEDQSEVFDAAKIHQFLLDLKKGDSSKILTYGVVIPTNDPTDCSRDEYNRPPQRIEEFFSLTKAQFYSLCDPDYGTKLSRIGGDLVERIGRRVLLDRRPIIETVEVTYGAQVILPDPETGWSYDATDNAIVLGRKIAWTEQPDGTTVEVYFKPVN
jgi:hypothetical protein